MAGEEKYWNMTSDNVLSICLCDVDEDEVQELVVGCEDSSINIFKGEELINEIEETSAVILLKSFGIQFFAFGLRNGSFGVYERGTRIWKEKYKEGIMGMVPVVRGDEFGGLIVGFRNGRVELRNSMNGSMLYNMQAEGQISSIMRSNFVDFESN